MKIPVTSSGYIGPVFGMSFAQTRNKVTYRDFDPFNIDKPNKEAVSIFESVIEIMVFKNEKRRIFFLFKNYRGSKEF